jgi:hypothetical protein
MVVAYGAVEAAPVPRPAANRYERETMSGISLSGLPFAAAQPPRSQQGPDRRGKEPAAVARRALLKPSVKSPQLSLGGAILRSCCRLVRLRPARCAGGMPWG